MSANARKFLPAVSKSEFELRHWRPAPAEPRSSLRRPDPAVPASFDLLKGDLDLDHWNSGGQPSSCGYVSLRELIATSPPSGISSPTAGEIQIRNPLLKQAAYAYLQLTPSSIESLSRRQRPIRRFLAAISAAFRPLRRCFVFIGRLFCCAHAKMIYIVSLFRSTRTFQQMVIIESKCPKSKFQMQSKVCIWIPPRRGRMHQHKMNFEVHAKIAELQ